MIHKIYEKYEKLIVYYFLYKYRFSVRIKLTFKLGSNEYEILSLVISCNSLDLRRL